MGAVIWAMLWSDSLEVEGQNSTVYDLLVLDVKSIVYSCLNPLKA